MRKVLLFIPAMLLTLGLSAKDVTIIPNADNVLRTTVDACTDDENTITLDKDETYGNVYGNTTSSIQPSKNVTIQAAEGANPVIKPTAPIYIQGGVTVKFIGIKFDGSIIGSYDRLLLFNDNNDDNVVEFEDCEFTAISKFIIDVYTGYKAKSIVFKNCYLHDNTSRCVLNRGTITSMEIKDSHFENFTSTWESPIENHGTGSIGTLEITGSEFNNITYYVIYSAKGTSINTCTINDCYFHNNARSAVYLDSKNDTQACNSLTIENSTFVDVSSGYNVIDFECPGERSFTANASLSVNHCTFYNHPKRAIYWQESTDLTVTNCVFAQPSSISYKSVECAGGTITNCLSYNSEGYSSSTTRTDNLTGNPYFVNIESGSYDLTPASFSPAHNAGADTKTLGDYLRWTSDDSAHPTTMNISAGTDAIKAAVEAAWPGDQIVMGTGTYNESAKIVLDKNITLKAANGASPIIKPVKDIAISNGSDVTIKKIKFDGSSQDASNFIYVADNAANSLSIDSCEFYHINNIVIHGKEASHVDECVISNCYFHNNDQQSIYFEASSNEGVETCDELTVTNSTFANTTALTNWISIIDIRPISKTNSIKVEVDHCTFYNNPTVDDGHANIRTKDISDVTVSNSIFAHPEEYARRATYCTGGGNINNCLTYNFTSSGTKGHAYGATVNAASMVADPLFINTATGFAVKGDYTTGQVSPARKAATDGTCLGDPRWYTDEIIPSTDFASPYKLEGGIAVISGNIWYDGTNDYLYYNDKSENGTALWKLHAEKECAVLVTLDMSSASTTGHKFKVEISNADGKIGELAEPSQTEAATPITLTGCIYLPAAGDYTILLTNQTAHSSSKIEGITLTYAGGAVQTITNSADFETDLDEAWFSSNGTRADGKISFPGSSMASAWVRWNVHVSNNDYYDVTVNFEKGDADHNCGVKLYNDLTTVFDKHATTSSQTGTDSPIRLGRFYIPEGDYIMEFTNPVTNSKAKLISVEAQAFDAPVISLPNTLPAASAITSELAYEDGGELYFTPSNKKGYILDQWAKWKVSVAAAGTFLFTMNVNSSLEQSYEITILDSENNELDSYAKNPGSGEKTIKHYFNLAAGNYFVMVQNTTNYSDGHMVSMVVSQPELVTLDEAETSNVSWAGKTEEETTYDVQIIRTIKAGMYNTFCLPFEVTSSQCKDIFGSDVKLRTLDEATVEEGDFVLNLNFAEAHDIYPGTPVLIQTSRDIVNPVFTGVKFTAKTPSATTKTNANFTGTFIKSSLEASEDILFLGANNTLYFPTASVEIKGMRGWFVIHGSGGGAAPAIRSARIVENEQVITAIDLVNGQETKTNGQKLIENGQLYILYNGQMYNVQGARVK